MEFLQNWMNDKLVEIIVVWMMIPKGTAFPTEVWFLQELLKFTSWKTLSLQKAFKWGSVQSICTNSNLTQDQNFFE